MGRSLLLLLVALSPLACKLKSRDSLLRDVGRTEEDDCGGPAATRDVPPKSLDDCRPRLRAKLAEASCRLRGYGLDADPAWHAIRRRVLGAFAEDAAATSSYAEPDFATEQARIEQFLVDLFLPESDADNIPVLLAETGAARFALAVEDAVDWRRTCNTLREVEAQAKDPARLVETKLVVLGTGPNLDLLFLQEPTRAAPAALADMVTLTGGAGTFTGSMAMLMQAPDTMHFTHGGENRKILPKETGGTLAYILTAKVLASDGANFGDGRHFNVAWHAKVEPAADHLEVATDAGAKLRIKAKTMYVSTGLGTPRTLYNESGVFIDRGAPVSLPVAEFLRVRSPGREDFFDSLDRMSSGSATIMITGAGPSAVWVMRQIKFRAQRDPKIMSRFRKIYILGIEEPSQAAIMTATYGRLNGVKVKIERASDGKDIAGIASIDGVPTEYIQHVPPSSIESFDRKSHVVRVTGLRHGESETFAVDVTVGRVIEAQGYVQDGMRWLVSGLEQIAPLTKDLGGAKQTVGATATFGPTAVVLGPLVTRTVFDHTNPANAISQKMTLALKAWSRAIYGYDDSRCPIGLLDAIQVVQAAMDPGGRGLEALRSSVSRESVEASFAKIKSDVGGGDLDRAGLGVCRPDVSAVLRTL